MSNGRKAHWKTSAVSDMTTGSPIRLLLGFAAPLFVGNLFQQLYSAVDTMIAGYNLGDTAVAAIGATSALYSLLVNLAAGLNSGYGIVAAQTYGSKNYPKLRKVAGAMAALNLTVTLVLTVLSLLFLRPLMALMQVPDTLFHDAYLYIGVILGGMVTTIAYNMFAGFIRAMGNSRTPLYFLIISCLTNLSMDVVFIVGLGWGVQGAAAATVIAQGLSAVLAGAYVFRNYKEVLPRREDFFPDWPLMREMTGIGISMAAMYCVVDLGSGVYQRSINALGLYMGDAVITAHTAARRIIGIMMMPLGSISTAYATFVGQNWGAKKTERLKQTLKQVLCMEIGWGVCSCVMVFAAGGTMVHLLTNTTSPDVLQNAVLSLRCHFLCYPALGVLFALRNALQSIGQKMIPVLSSGVELSAKLIAGLWLIPRYGYMVVCLTEPVIWVVCAAFLAGFFLFKKPFDTREEQNDRWGKGLKRRLGT